MKCFGTSEMYVHTFHYFYSNFYRNKEQKKKRKKEKIKKRTNRKWKYVNKKNGEIDGWKSGRIIKKNVK